MLAKPASCSTCPGYAWASSGFQPLPEVPTASRWNGVLLVTDHLREAEAAAGKPFQGRAGWAFTQTLQRVGLDRGDFLIDSALRCRPPDNKLNGLPIEMEVLSHCGGYLDTTIRDWKPKVIVPMGDVAMQRVLALPKSEKITPRRGWVEWSHRYSCWVIPTLHPNFLLQGNQHLSGVFLADIGHAIDIAAKGHRWAETSYLLDPPPSLAIPWVEEFEAACRRGEPIWLAADIETPYKANEEDESDLDFEDPTYTILRVGFAWQEGRALSLPYDSSTIPLIARLLRSSATKLWWNQRYDVPRLVANGLAPAGIQWDMMWAWHIVNSDLPKGLAFVASLLLHDQQRWKHLGKSEPARYNAMDADITRKVATRIVADLHTHHLSHVFDRHIVRLDQILSQMSQKGILLDQEARVSLSNDVATLLAASKAKIQEVVPLSAKDVFFYKVTPKDLTGLVEMPTVSIVPRCSVCGKEKPPKAHFKTFKKKVNPCSEGTQVLRQEEVIRWARIADFVPSITRMNAYQRVMNHEPRRSKNKERRITFDEGAIRDLRIAYPKDPLYPLIVEYREYEKLLTNYVGRWDGTKWEGGPPCDRDSVVHTTYSHEPSTLRFSSQNPNLQNVPRGNDSTLQARVKEMFVARPGYRLGEFDYKAIEAVLVGYFANDEGYYRLAKLGVHDFLNSHNLKRLGLLAEPADVRWSDDDLKACFKELKSRFPSTYRDVAKRTVHMCLTGDHEVLTTLGWVRLDKYKGYEPVAQWEEGGRITFVYPEIHNGPNDQPLLSLHGRGISAVMTADHRVPVREIGERRAIDLKKSDRIPITGVCEGSEPIRDDLRLAAAIQADGSLKSYGSVVFHFTKTRKIERLLAMFTRMGITPRIVPCKCHPGKGMRITIYAADTKAALRYLTPRKTWDLPTLLLLNANAKRELIQEVLEWAGCRMAGRCEYGSMRCENAEAIQTLAHLSGSQALLRHAANGLWITSFNRRRFARVEMATRKWVEAAPTYCLTVPSSFFLIRHDGRISVTGNSNYGGTPKRMRDTNPDLFPTAVAAQALQTLYFEVCPAIRRWQQATIRRADEEGYLRNPFGYIHRFWQVQNWKKTITGEWEAYWGEDAKRVLAFLPQSTAAGIIKEAMLRIEERGMASCLRLQVHDSLVIEAAAGAPFDWALQLVASTMSEPIREMLLPWAPTIPLSIDIEAKVGDRWGSLSEIHL